MATLYGNAAGDIYEKPLSSNRGVSLRAVPPAPPGSAIEPSRVPNFTMPNGAPPAAATAAPATTMRSAGPVAPTTTAGAVDADMKAGPIRKFLRTPSPGFAAAAGITGALQGMETPTENYYNRFGMDPAGVGDNFFKDAAVRAGGVISDVGAAALDTPMSLVNGVRKLAGAKPLETFGEALRRNDGPATSTVAENAFGVQQTGQPVAPPAPTGVPGAPAALAAPTNLVSRQGNSFSGNNIREGFSYEDGPGSRPSAGNMTVLNTSEGARQDQLELGRLRAEAAERQAGFAANQPGGGLSGFSGSPVGLRAGGDDTTSRVRELVRSGMSLRQAGSFANQEAQLAEQRRSSDQAAGVQMAGIGSNAQVAMRGQDIGAGTAMRGQDMTLAANRANAQLAVRQSLRDQANKDREFTATQDQRGFERQQTVAKNLTDQIASWVPPVNVDGKQMPDQQTAARYSTAIQTAVGRLGKSLTDLSDADKGRFIQGMQLADVVGGTATNGITPWGTKAIVSNEPVLALKKLPDGNYQTNRRGVNGETEIIPARYVEKEGTLFGLQYFGKSSNRFADLIVKEPS